MKITLTLILFLSTITVARAETGYIGDQLKLPMRTGQSLSHAIVRMLPTGTTVEILERNRESGYTHIRTLTGKEGWILSRYLMKTPAARDQLASAEKRLVAITKEKALFDTRLKELKQKKNALEQALNKSGDQNSKLAKDLEAIRHASSNAVKIAAENRSLRTAKATAEEELKSLRQETRTLKNGAAQRWFLLGGSAILLGILLGIFLPNLRMQKRSRWGKY